MAPMTLSSLSRGLVCVCVAIGIASGISGCSRQDAGEGAPAGEPVVSGRPALGMVTSQSLSADERLLRKAAQTTNIFGLYELRDSYTAGDSQSSETLTMIGERIEAVQRQLKPIGPLLKNLVLVAFDYRYVSENEYETLWLCLPRTNIGTNYHFILYGFPDPNHYGQLSDGARKNGEKTNEFYETWQFEPQPPISACKAGQYILFRHVIAAQPIPYNMQARLWSKEEDMGATVALGWWAATPQKD